MTALENLSGEREQCEALLSSEGPLRLESEAGRAWSGLLRTHRQLSRMLEADLRHRHRLTLSALELLGRLAAADGNRLRLARLAAQAELSLSRTSRLVDQLATRGLLDKVPCPDDSRASEAVLTEAGAALARRAQADHAAAVQRLFVERLTREQLQTLSLVFATLAG
jgi:DNA-binding MarR family transcriptional regulator